MNKPMVYCLFVVVANICSTVGAVVPGTLASTRYGVMVHEASHLALNTFDIPPYARRNLASDSARRNAYHWEIFIIAYVSSRPSR